MHAMKNDNCVTILQKTYGLIINNKREKNNYEIQQHAFDTLKTKIA